ncbi:MAG: NAD-dependent epimerase/dehydratase family protein [Oscillospiraceae bacterium]|nr:NAD-dependent epimerase/dehydratase family protein [Oscillospiraceae bacterium]
MKKILVTGGTVFVSRFVANYFARKGNDVYVLNRNSRPQLPNVTLLEGDRNQLGDALKGYTFDAVLDITAYTREHVENLVNALGEFTDYILISSSAVYPETNPRPFTEDQDCGPNSIWGAYGTNKLAAEAYLQQAVPQAYILRPPYLYGPMQNIYRESFVFECAEAGRKFCIPGDGSMPLQFFHVEDLCRFMEVLLEQHPVQHIYNVGNPEAITVSQWVQLCYEIAGANLETISIDGHPQRNYFCFHDYDYFLDVTRQSSLMPDVKPLAEGLQESYEWFRKNRDAVMRRPYTDYIDTFVCPKP